MRLKPTDHWKLILPGAVSPIKLNFSPAFEVHTDGSVDVRGYEVEKYRQQSTEAKRQAYNAGCGLLIHSYDYRSDFFLDFQIPVGQVRILYFNGE